MAIATDRDARRRRIVWALALTTAACSGRSGGTAAITAGGPAGAATTLPARPATTAVAPSSAASATGSSANGGTTAGVTGPSSSAAPAPAGACPTYRSEVRGTLPGVLTELSGWALSTRRPGVLWGHNDSGDKARLVAVSAVDAALLADVTVTGVKADDWEDVATYTDRTGQHWIVVADTGDNAEHRDDVSLVFVPEPDVSATTVAAAGVVTVRWAGGAHDVEALVVDPISGDATVVGKRFTGAAEVSVDRIPAAAMVPGTSVTAQRVGTFRVPDGQAFGPTAGTIDATGTTVGLLFYGRLTLTWARAPGTSVADTVLGPPTCAVASGSGKYESLAITDDGTLLTATEGHGVPVIALVPERT